MQRDEQVELSQGVIDGCGIFGEHLSEKTGPCNFGKGDSMDSLSETSTLLASNSGAFSRACSQNSTQEGEPEAAGSPLMIIDGLEIGYMGSGVHLDFSCLDAASSLADWRSCALYECRRTPPGEVTVGNDFPCYGEDVPAQRPYPHQSPKGLSPRRNMEAADTMFQAKNASDKNKPPRHDRCNAKLRRGSHLALEVVHNMMDAFESPVEQNGRNPLGGEDVCLMSDLSPGRRLYPGSVDASLWYLTQCLQPCEDKAHQFDSHADASPINIMTQSRNRLDQIGSSILKTWTNIRRRVSLSSCDLEGGSEHGEDGDHQPAEMNGLTRVKSVPVDEWAGRSSFRDFVEPSISTPWPEVDDAEFGRGKALLRTLELDALSFNSDTLLHLALEIFMVELQLDGQLRIPVVKFQRFLLSVRERMLDNPYHNFHHVFDVLQTTLALGLKGGLIASLSTMERFALGVAALCHDLEHPGINNAELVQLVRTIEGSNLEKHHSRLAFQIMVLEEVDLLKGFSTSKYYAFRDCVFKLILATDMSRHEEYMQRVAGLTDGKTADKQLAMELLMKCSDVSNVIKPFPIAKKWAVRITDEFFAQGDMERERGLPVTPTCDRFVKTRVQLQKSFSAYIAPLFDNMESAFPRFKGLFPNLHSNRADWEQYSDEMLMAEVSDGW